MSENKSFLRNVIGEYMSEIGKKNDKVVVVNADLSGTCRNKGFVAENPERSFNTGIAEQNMVSFGAGLACEGFIPYVFSMAPFLTMRACEQCRTDVAYGNRNVRMIGVYAGVSGGISGATHWAIEDCGIMTSVPNIAVFEVSDANQARRLLDYSLKYDGPMYIRSSVEPTENIYDEDIDVRAGGSMLVMDGNDGAFLCSGVTVQYAMAAARSIYEETGKKIRVIDMYSIKPIDRVAIYEAAKTGNIVVAQDHNIYGGLGSMVSMVIAENNLSTRFKVCGVSDKFVAMAHAGYLYHYFGMDAEGLKAEMTKMIRGE
jgi:transketolase